MGFGQPGKPQISMSSESFERSSRTNIRARARSMPCMISICSRNRASQISAGSGEGAVRTARTARTVLIHTVRLQRAGDAAGRRP